MPDGYMTWVPDDFWKLNNDAILKKYLSLRLDAETLTELADATETIGLLLHTLATALGRLKEETRNHGTDTKIVEEIVAVIEKVMLKYQEDKE
jgi:hypothetical protein